MGGSLYRGLDSLYSAVMEHQNATPDDKSEPLWFYAQNSKNKVGPMSLERLQQLADSGQIRPTDMVLREGDQKWMSLAEVPRIFFWRDLRSVVPRLHVKSIDTTVPVLAELFQKRRDAFFRGLSTAALEVARRRPDYHLSKLEDIFKKAGEDARNRIRQLFPHDEDDPLRCPISLFGTMDLGRLETAHTNVLAWLLNPK